MDPARHPNNIARYNERRAQEARHRRAATRPANATSGSRVWRWVCWVLYLPSRALNWTPGLSILVFACMPRAMFPHLSRNIAAGTSMFEQLANMTGSAATAAGLVSSSVGAVALGTSQSVLNVAHDVWKGVDLSNVSLRLDLGRAVVLHSEAFSQLIANDIGNDFSAMPTAMKDELLLLVSRISPWMPLLQLDRRQSLLHESYSSLEALAVSLPGGFVGVSWRWATASFDVVWSNPMWCPLFDSTSEVEQIAQVLTSAVTRMGGPSWRHPLRADAFGDVPFFTPTYWQWMQVQLRRCLRLLTAWLTFVAYGGLP